jgi:outer membrane protein assembly factor BamB
MSTDAASAVNATPRQGVRHVWFPIVVIALAAVWWALRMRATGYVTIYDVLIALLGAVLVSIWFVRCGPGVKRYRSWAVWSLWIAFFVWMTIFKPVYNGDMGIWRWQWRFGAKADQQLDALEARGEAIDWQPTERDYPRFLGTGYWPEVTGVELESDWQSHPPQEVWRREVGAGWSSFAVVGNYAVTQEQRGGQEIVSCYRVDDGELVWTHADDTRFDPADFQGGLGGIGPRATPTIVDDRVYTQGGTGIVNCLEARTGRVNWRHDTAAETDADVLVWGKSGSPLVVDDLVIVNVGAPNDVAQREKYNSSLVAYDRETGEKRWTAGNRQASYSSPVLATIAGQPQVLVLNESYLTSHRPSDGAVLWEMPWSDEFDTNATTTQPIPLPDDRIFLSKGYGVGSSLLEVERDTAGKLTPVPVWEPAIKRVMKTKFNNPVVRDGYVYGLDDVLLECLELETGKVQWKKRREPRFGHGQLLLVGDVLLVQTEYGELVLVEATPEEYRELGSVQVLDPVERAWNTPAFAPPYLLVRNPREMACYRLPLRSAAE